VSDMVEDKANDESGVSAPGVPHREGEEKQELPSELPILPLKNQVGFPIGALPLAVEGEREVKLMDGVMAGDRLLGVVTQKDEKVEKPGPEDLYTVGTAGMVVKMIRVPDGTQRVLIQPLGRIRLEEFTQTDPQFRAKITELHDEKDETVQTKAVMRHVLEQFTKIVSMVPQLPAELQVVAMNTDDPGMLADFVASVLGPSLKLEERQMLLEELNVKRRLERLSAQLQRELEVLELTSKIQSSVQGEMSKQQKDFYLRKQLEAIRKELGEEDTGKEIEELRQKIEEAQMPEEAKEVAEKELSRLSQMHPSAAEYTVARTYLDWLIVMPWNKQTEDQLEIGHARQILDRDHYGLEKVKERILEYLSVRKLKPDTKSPILCFVGPPGTGKTSIGRSIAESMGRKFIRMSLGGVRDEAEIRGHRRTYVGALPGRIIQGVRRAGSRNPVFMLDEVDKIGADFRGDPSAALLEVLDPEQNFSFSDHYLDVAFDLSKVLFITTANILQTIPPALQDRMEVLEFPGYTEGEKIGIAKRHLVPRQLTSHGIPKGKLHFSDASLRKIIRDFTREAGLRNLEREIANVCRKFARKLAEGEELPEEITPEEVAEMLGAAKFFQEVKERMGRPGVAVGVAWTQAGGDIIFVEAAKMRGKGKLVLTGQLGEVMKESAQAALTYIRSRAGELGIDEELFGKTDIHIHVPAGAIPKDGPSAGITMTVALASLLMDAPVRPDVAMTGEITLRGNVLPVGGIKEKVLAARRAEIKHVILPERNEKDLSEVREEIKKGMKFDFVKDIDEVLKTTMEKAGKKPKKKAGSSRKPAEAPA